ncbi:hypothetical protein [Nonomuraea lactucae]|uniref:hypothetical protein n=1 Tax=Nonomuraea lactucae TaxID=2249762 RepID=UPI0013B36125|nr:hypothetical protein [Nonomuraea lactucae]
MARQGTRRDAKDSIDWVVGLSLVMVVLVTSGLSYALTYVAQNPRIKPGAQGYVEFATLYTQTLILSATMTAAVAAVTIPRIYGRWCNPGWALIVVAAGSFLTGRSITGPETVIRDPDLMWISHGYTKAMRLFAIEYGPAFYGGVIVGLAGGVTVSIALGHHRAAQIAARRPWSGEKLRPMIPWGPVAALVIAVICVLAYLASLPW